MNNDSYVVKSLADKTVRTKLFTKILALALAVFAVIALTILGTTEAIKNDKNLFEIISGPSEGDAVISLSNDREFTSPTNVLQSKSINHMNNISYTSIPDNVNEIDGPHNGRHYFAHTFYVKNAGKVVFDLHLSLDIVETFKGAEKAMWVRLYQEGEYITYAHPKDDGSIEFGTESFFSKDKAIYRVIENMKPNEIIKFTLVIWLEGNDPDCTNAIKGGFVRFAMEFSSGLNKESQ